MKYLKKFNENVNDIKNFSDEDLELMRTHMDEEGIVYMDITYDNIKHDIELVINGISGDLEDYTNNVSSEMIIKDTIGTDFGKYEYVVTLKRIG